MQSLCERGVSAERRPGKPVVEFLLQSGHHVRGNGQSSVADRTVTGVTPADRCLHEVAGTVVAVAEEPDVCCDGWVCDVGFELVADADCCHGLGEAPEVLGGKVVPVVRSARGYFS